MFSLIVWLAVLLSQVLLTALALSWAARAVGSSRGRFAIALRATIILFILSIIMAVAYQWVIAKMPPQALLIQIGSALLIFISNQFLTLFLFREMFKLSWGRAFAPFGAYIAVAAIILILAFAIIEPHLTRPFVISSSSMNPTLETGDRVFVNETVPPRRWQLVIYHSNSRDGFVLCKRLLGLPSERIRFEGERLYINDKIADPPYALHGHFAGMKGRPPLTHDGQTITLGPNEFFFIGDNLENSLDSRIQGPTDRAKLVGVVDFQFWPLTRMKLLR